MNRLLSALLWAVICTVALVVFSIAITYVATRSDPSQGGLGVMLIFMGVPVTLIGGAIYGYRRAGAKTA